MDRQRLTRFASILGGGEDVLHEILNQLFYVCQPVISLSTSTSTPFQCTLKDAPWVSCWVTWSNQFSLHLFTFGEKGFWWPTRGVTMLRTKSLCVLCWRFGAVLSDTWCGMPVFSCFSNHYPHLTAAQQKLRNFNRLYLAVSLMLLLPDGLSSLVLPIVPVAILMWMTSTDLPSLERVAPV